MPLQMRIPANANDRLYNPDRDLAYCMPHLIMRAFLGLDPDRQEPWIADFCKSQGITNEDLVKGVEAYTKYLNNTVLDPQFNQPFEALAEAGFFALPSAVQLIICAKLGQVVTSAFFPAIRDVTRDPESPPFDRKSIDRCVTEVSQRMLRTSV